MPPHELTKKRIVGSSHQDIRPEVFHLSGVPVPYQMELDDFHPDYWHGFGSRLQELGHIDPPIRTSPEMIKILKAKMNDINWRILFDELKNSN